MRTISLFLLSLILMATITLQAQSLNSAQQEFQALKYGIMVHFMPHGAPNAIVADPNGVWENTVNNFSVSQFVSDIQATGAKWVIFPTGQTTGFYTSFNNYYNNKIGTTPGQYTATKDLVHEVALALKAVGIKTMAYFAAEGPTQLPANLKSAFPITTDQAPADTRATINAMLSEWSIRWGTDIIGWWFDGCFVSGYRDSEANLNALCDAAKAGNPNSMIATNSACEQFSLICTNQDYIAGEENRLHRYPYTSTPLSFNNKAMVWQVLSFTGTWWGNFDTLRYTSDQLARYIKDVNDRGGVIAMDVGINANGSLGAAQKAQWAYVKSVLRDNQPFATYSNIARYKPAFYMSNQSDLHQLQFNGASYMHSESFATDGIHNDSLAMSGGEWTWSLLVDLNQATAFNRVVIDFDANNFATNYTLMSSNNRQSWSDIGTYSASAGGIIQHDFSTVSARYLRVRQNTPDGPGQGNGMGFKEIEVYNTNATSVAPKTAIGTGNSMSVVSKKGNSLIIGFSNPTSGILSIYNIRGQEVKVRNIQGEQKVTLNTNELEKGSLVITFLTNNTVVTSKIFIE